MTIDINGSSCAILYNISPSRAIIDYGGGVVLADCIGGRWELSGDPTTDEERKIVNSILAPEMDTTLVTITDAK